VLKLLFKRTLNPLKGFNLGAVDYLVKPAVFKVGEHNKYSVHNLPLSSTVTATTPEIQQDFMFYCELR
jgi:hypothetical protein